MKKLFVLAALFLFAGQVYALEAKIYGEHELSGTWLINDSFGDDTEFRPNADTTSFEQYLEIWAEISPAPGTRIILSVVPLDRTMGDGDYGNEENNGDLVLDTAWIEYDVTDSLTLSGGRMPNDYAPYGWAQGFYDGGFLEYWAVDGFNASYNLSDGITLWARYQKDIESSTGRAGIAPQAGEENGRDADTYMLGGELNFGDLYFNPRLSYHHNAVEKSVQDSIALFSVYLDGAYLPETGLNFIVGAAYVGGDSGNGSVVTQTQTLQGDTYAAWGLYADVSYVTESFTMGALAAYSSYDKEKGYFTFGGDFDRTSLIDDEIFSEYGVPAMAMAQIYGELYFDRLTVMPSVSYYMSNVSSGYTVLNEEISAIRIGEDTKAFEFDLLAEYALTDYTTISAGYALAFINDLDDGSGNKYDSDPAHKLFWAVTTQF